MKLTPSLTPSQTNVAARRSFAYAVYNALHPPPPPLPGCFRFLDAALGVKNRRGIIGFRAKGAGGILEHMPAP